MYSQHIPLFKYKEFLEKIVEKDSLEVIGQYKLTFRCPVCGDSKKSKTKKRGALLISPEGGAVMTCLNCGYSSSFYYYLKNEQPELCKQWIMDVMFLNPTYEKDQEIEVKEIYHIDYSLFKSLKDKSGLKVRNNSIKLINERRIPKHIAKHFLYCDEGKYQNRLIIPHYLRDGTFKYFEARALDKNNFLRYMYPIGLPQSFYNLNFVDKSKKYHVFEGAIDSFFVDNSVCCGGASKIEAFMDNIEDKYYENMILIFDGDEDGINKSFKMLKRGIPVFVWTKEMMDLGDIDKDTGKRKIDMNKLIMQGFFDNVLDEKGQVPESEISKYVSDPSLPSLLEFELHYSDLGFELGKKKKYVGTFQGHKS